MYLHCLHVLEDTLMCTLHVYKPTVQPVASRRLFFDLQVVTIWLVEFTLLARANLYYPTTRLRLYFFTNICSTLTCVYTYDGM